MTGAVRLTGATPCLGNYWKSIDWKKVRREVKRLQMRIAKAVRENRWNKVRCLERTLTHSFFAKLLAVKRVSSRKGSRTPGVDNVIWNTPAKKMRGALSLNTRNYKASPLKRKLIPKKNGKMRTLGIPTMKDRAMQALFLLYLEPIAETTADNNSYGFRRFRGCRDAVSQCFCALGKSYSAQWILDADIKACFDEINHSWLLENIPMNKKILRQWLESGFVYDRQLFPTRTGTPQGGIASPTLANMTLDGLESTVRNCFQKRIKGIRTKINFIRYADDFIVTAASKEILQDKVIPAINDFLKLRGLKLSPEKTRIAHIDEGFNFLGQNLRKYNNKLIIQPAKDNVKSFLEKVKGIMVKYRGCKTEILIRKLNPVIRGWGNYHRLIQSSKAFGRLQEFIHDALIKWAKRQNGDKTLKWIYYHFWGISSDKKHFACVTTDKKGRTKKLELLKLTDIRLARYIKIKGAANTFDPEYQKFFWMRRKSKNMTIIQTNSLRTAGLTST